MVVDHGTLVICLQCLENSESFSTARHRSLYPAGLAKRGLS